MSSRHHRSGSMASHMPGRSTGPRSPRRRTGSMPVSSASALSRSALSPPGPTKLLRRTNRPAPERSPPTMTTRRRSLGAALHSMDDSWGHRRRGFWDAWAKRTSSTSFDPDDQEKTWEGFERDREDGVTWRTIRFVAIENGWRPRTENGSADTPAPEPETFVRSDRGGILKTHPQNVRLAIRRLGVSLRYNEFSIQPEVAGLRGFGPELTDAGAIRLLFLIHETYDFLPSRDLVERVITDIAHQNRFHPVREWLAGLQWDGVSRINSWLTAYAGAKDTPFNRALGKIFLIAGVRRVRRPGVKFDTM